MSKDYVIEILRIIASMVIPIVALLRTRTDLDRFAAAQRAKESGKPTDTMLRKKWYHKLKRLDRGNIR
jgi:hypothetical protein